MRWPVLRPGFAGYLEVRFGIENGAQPCSDQKLVVGDQDPDRHRAVPVGSKAETVNPPGAGAAVRLPPAAAALSVIP
jgi:hypothetical protein